ncbi:hypothetical protein LEM8419_00102 [Neolewinella maritima]|uniref:DUF4252 domain-containing protein n=1 Tax=Neolewinella maritima TaxID=1383882 RepID=A0ABM9AX41_9BACT|nr:DUF4252 domain-containing protein [Neolewinella maritima]CAH0998754.1 hypothetical protein LEM8419_00102 [Neolewinella maritima]
MRYLTTLLLLLYLAPAAAQNALPLDAISNYFSEYVDDERFTAVYVSGKMFELFEDAKIDLDEIDEDEVRAILEVVRDIKGIRVLNTDVTPLKFYEEAKGRIRTDTYELLFKVRTQDGQNVEAFIQNDRAIVNELFLLVGTRDTFAMLSFVGNIDLSKLSELQQALD